MHFYLKFRIFIKSNDYTLLYNETASFQFNQFKEHIIPIHHNSNYYKSNFYFYKILLFACNEVLVRHENDNDGSFEKIFIINNGNSIMLGRLAHESF